MIKQHICIVLHDFNAGGTEAIALRLAGEWLRQGRAVSLVVGAGDGPMRARVPQGARVVVLDPPIPRSALSRLRLGEAMVPALRALAPDVVFLPGNYHFVLAHALRRHFPALPILAKVSNPLLPPLPPPIRRIAVALTRWLLAPIDALVFMSAELLAADRGVIGAIPATVVPEPNLPDDYAPLPRSGPLSPPLILAIGRLEPQKNLALAIRAFARLVARRPARLVILGEGRERAKLEALVRKLGLEGRVEMPGFVPDGATRLSQASLLLMTSRYEGFPAVLVEALAADVPVVSTNCSPAQKALIANPMHGVVVDRASPDRLADAMEEVLAQPFSSAFDSGIIETGGRAAGLDGHAASASAAAYLALFDSTNR